MGVGEFNEHGL